MLAFKIAERFIEAARPTHLFIDECGDAVEDQRLNVAVSVDFWQRNSEAPVDLKKLLSASNDVFFHDVIGILKSATGSIFCTVGQKLFTVKLTHYWQSGKSATVTIPIVGGGNIYLRLRKLKPSALRSMIVSAS